MFKRIKGTGVMKKTAAFALSLVMASGAFAVLPGGFDVMASAEEKCEEIFEEKTDKYEDEKTEKSEDLIDMDLSVEMQTLDASNGAQITVSGNQLVSYVPNGNVIDLTDSRLANVKSAKNGAFKFGSEVDTIKIGNNAALLKPEYFFNGCNNHIANVYVNGKKVECGGANDTVPQILKDNYELLNYSKFSFNYANQKAHYLLNSMGLSYYGSGSWFYKGTLDKGTEYMATRKIHDYIYNNYTYNIAIIRGENAGKWSFLRVFNCHTDTVCEYDAQMYAFLLENAGVEAEVVYSGIPVEIEYDEYIARVANKENDGLFTQGSKYYRTENNGNHSWLMVKIGNDWYNLDVTNDRSSIFSSYQFFLVPDSYLHSEVVELIKDGKAIHGYPHIKGSGYSADMLPFQGLEPNSKAPECVTKRRGDADGDKYVDNDDILMIRAYSMMPEETKSHYESWAKGRMGLTPRDVQLLNGCKYNGRTIYLVSNDNYLKPLLDLTNADVNFDGKIDIRDAVELSVYSTKKTSV